MDNKDRAEKIQQYAIDNLIGDKNFTNFVTAQLEEAIHEAWKDFQLMLNAEIEHAKEKGFAAAREKAAGIADKASNTVGEHLRIAERIRKMEA